MRNLLRVAAIAWVIGGAVCAGGYYASLDVAPPDDSSLKIHRRQVPDAQNAWTYFQEAETSLKAPEQLEEEDRIDALLRLEKWNERYVESWLSRNASALKTWRHGLDMSACVKPRIKIHMDAQRPHLDGFRKLARMAALRAIYQHRQGKHEAAFEECLGVVRFGHLLQDSGGALVVYLVGADLKKTGVNTWYRLLHDADVFGAELSNYAAELRAYRTNDAGLIRALKVSYKAWAKTIDDIAAGRYPGKYEPSRLGLTLPEHLEKNWHIGIAGILWKPNHTKRLVARVTCTAIRNVPRPFDEVHRSPIPQVFSGSVPRTLARLVLSGNPVGRTLAAMTGKYYQDLPRRHCREQLRIAALRTILALKGYEESTGHIPASLGALVPRYLNAVPTDPFDGQPLRYSREKKIIYSVGEDLEDSGGSTGENRWEMADPTYDIPLSLHRQAGRQREAPDAGVMASGQASTVDT